MKGAVQNIGRPDVTYFRRTIRLSAYQPPAQPSVSSIVLTRCSTGHDLTGAIHLPAIREKADDSQAADTWSVVRKTTRPIRLSRASSRTATNSRFFTSR